jgi:hypothetical protein
LSRLVVAPVVEGHGEDNAIRILIQRTWAEIVHGDFVEVLRPIRSSRGRLAKEEELSRAVNLAALKLRALSGMEPAMILILVDADNDLPCVLAPKLLEIARRSRSDVYVSCVVANVEYETWFIAAAESLAEYLDLSADELIPEDPERQRLGKGWIKRRFRGIKYSETVDQPAMTSQMDLSLCRRRSHSFAKLCRELEGRLTAGGSN